MNDPQAPGPRYLRFIGYLDDKAAERILLHVEHVRDNGATEIHLALSILGGITQTAVAVYNSLAHHSTAIHTYNIGTIASAGATAFLGGHHRYCSAIGTFLIHPHSTTHNGHLSMAQAASMVLEAERAEKQLDSILRERTTISEDLLWDRSIKDVFFNAQEAVAVGLVSEIREFAAPAGARIVQVA